MQALHSSNLVHGSLISLFIFSIVRSQRKKATFGFSKISLLFVIYSFIFSKIKLIKIEIKVSGCHFSEPLYFMS